MKAETHSPRAAAGRWLPERAVGGIPEHLVGEGAFVPRPLPAELALSSSTYRKVADAQEALGRLDEAAQRLPDWATLVRTTQVREVQSSANLDGAHLALREVLVSQLPGVKPESAIPPAVAGYLRASDTAFTAVESGEPVDTALLCRVSAAFAGNVVEDNSVWRVGPAGAGASTPEDWVVVSPAGPEARVGMAQLDVWANSDEPDIPIVARVALGHYQLELLQPFGYGNGHIARLYVGLKLAEARLLRGHLLPMSLWIDRHRHRYRAQLRKVIDTGDVEPWVAFFADGVRLVALSEVRLIKELEAARDDILDRLGRSKSAVRKVAAGLVATPVTNHRQIAERHAMTANSAREHCATLVKAGVLRALDDRRYAKTFVCPAFLQLLTESAALAQTENEAQA